MTSVPRNVSEAGGRHLSGHAAMTVRSQAIEPIPELNGREL